MSGDGRDGRKALIGRRDGSAHPRRSARTRRGNDPEQVDVAALYQQHGAHTTEVNRQNDRSARQRAYAGVVRGTPRRPLPAERLLEAAGALFDREGIRAVGVDRLVAEADVARASLYQNFGSKDALVLAWLSKQDEVDRAGYDRALRAAARSADGPADPMTRIRTFFDLAVAATRRRHYRGCLYVNALTEFPDRDHSVHMVVAEHRRWMREEIADAAAMAGAADPAEVARSVQLLYDGGLVGAKTARSVEPIRRAEQLAAELVEAAVVRGSAATART
ncbi:hypothetical protein PSU4_55900 [Pseudonocardia sulfidoxydans NBRC 16205]|uniref:HTH tetR-type domain-containing protein n=1 Tax=Pseudonocardia sulfidoxydans NBRC 16205 TaxID=1223511 RepID=A0A511DP85_9PSEU|nr:hypothetical protein PSU4_55900 [Pseudonocardia sulfidoxydans NBRC 16205]